MRKDIALAGKVDAEHRSRQNLRYGTLGDDLLFLRHCAANIRASADRLKSSASNGAAVSSPPLSGDLEIASPWGNRQDCLRYNLAELVQRKRWQIFPKLLTFPPNAGLAKLVHRCKAVAIKHRTNVMRRSVRE